MTTNVETLNRHANTDERLRRPAQAAPQAAIFAREAVIVLTGLGDPIADPVFGAAKLDDAGTGWMIGDAPVEAIAAEIHEAAALIQVAAQRIQHGGAVVFRMRPGDHHSVSAQQSEAFGMQVLIGDDVERLSHRLEPVDNMEIGVELPRR